MPGEQVKNYGYIPSALPDAKCFGDEGSKSPSDITKALSDAFASNAVDAPLLNDSPGLSSSSSSSLPDVGAVTAFTSRAAAELGEAGGEAVAQVVPPPPRAVPHQGVNALFEFLES